MFKGKIHPHIEFHCHSYSIILDFSTYILCYNEKVPEGMKQYHRGKTLSMMSSSNPGDAPFTGSGRLNCPKI